MNLSEQITKLLKGGISEITFGMNPQGQPFVAVTQNMATVDRPGNITQIRHQKCSSNLVECVEAVAKDIEHCAELQVKIPDGKIIQVPRG